MATLPRPAFRMSPHPGRARGLRAGWRLAAAALLLALPGAGAETIKVGGTGGALGTLRMLAAEFAKTVPAHSIVVLDNLGTRGGVKALAVGAIDIAALSRPLTADEAAQGLVAVEYGKTAFVIATSTQAAGTFTTLAQLADIYAGRRATWPGGGPIRLVMRQAIDNETQLLKALSPELTRVVPDALARPGMIIAASDREAADFIERTPGAIGTTTLALVRSEKRNLTLVPLNGVAPSVQTLADGSYPYTKPMVLARRGAGTPGVARFYEFVGSGRGRQILAETGHWVADARAGR